MRICPTKSEMRAAVAGFRAEGETVGLVPTMGYLHEGHLSLVRRARAENRRVVVSIFVNPTQFGPKEDFAAYPRDPDRDLALLRAEGVDAVLMPSSGEMYAADRETVVTVESLSRILIGRLRPGHFQGVATVVAKLFNIVTPDAAYFGEKDFQQVAVIRRMVRDLDMDLRIVAVPTLREPDGLAMSSRNVRLAPADRAAAPVLHRALLRARELAAQGLTARQIARATRDLIDAEPRANVQSVDLRDAESLAALAGPLTRPAVLLLAVRFGAVLLIDNLVLTP